jgi:cytochrome b
MATVDSLDHAGGASPPAMMPVWDRFVRIFHWSLAALFAIAFLTGDEIEGLHLAAGYAILALVVLRLVWGFVGPGHARFASFVRGPRAVLVYLRETLHFRAPRHIGHNPAGGAMVVALLALLVATGITGYMMTTDAFWGAEWVEEVHEALANLTLAMVVLHVLGVLVASFEHGENLVRAMITGRKRAR